MDFSVFLFLAFASWTCYCLVTVTGAASCPTSGIQRGCPALELFASIIAGQGPLPAERLSAVDLFAILHVNYSLSRGTSFRITQMTSLKRGFLNLRWQQLLPPWEHSFS